MNNLSETFRMQFLSGIITESEYKSKLNEAEEASAMADAKNVEDKVESDPKIESAINKLSDEEKTQLSAQLEKLGITPNSSIKDVANKIEDKINEALLEAEGDPKEKAASVLQNIGGALVTQNFIPILSLIIGQAINPSSPFLTGVGLTLGVGGALIGLAKALGSKESKKQ